MPLPLFGGWPKVVWGLARTSATNARIEARESLIVAPTRALHYDSVAQGSKGGGREGGDPTAGSAPLDM
jgi:hypothetical protein